MDNLREVAKDSQSITLEWSLASSQLNPSSTSLLSDNNEWIGFKIKYSTDKLLYTPIMLKNIQLRKFRLDNLKPNTEYKIQLSAVDKNEFEGPATDFLIVKTLDAGLYFN